MNQKLIAGVIIVALLLVGGYMFSTSTPSVAAQGYSSIKAKPDQVSVYVNIQTKGDTAQEAQDKNSETRDAVVSALKLAGISEDEIQFANYAIYPEYDWNTGQQKQTGYVANQDIVVKTSDFDSVAKIVDASIQAGGLVSYINFELSDEKQSEYKTQALEAASQDAQKKANAVASGLGKGLGRLVAVESQDFNYGPIAYYARAESAGASYDNAQVKEAAMNISPQDIEVTGSVTVTYKLSVF